MQPKSTSQNAISLLEQELLILLKQEYTFYQSLYVLLDKQSDLLKYDSDQNLLDLYTEIERCQKRIKASEEKVATIKSDNPRLFKLAVIHPDVKKTTNAIATLVKKSIQLVESNNNYLNERHERICREIGALKSSSQIMQYMAGSDETDNTVDEKETLES